MLPACHCCGEFSTGQLRFPLWEPFVLEPTGPHEGTNYSVAQQDGGAKLLPRCSELIITSTLQRQRTANKS